MKIQGVRYYQELIGILRWAVELGRIDITMEVSMLSSHLALPPRRTFTAGLSHVWILESQAEEDLSL